jgi:quinol monooxygenase YgiN
LEGNMRAKHFLLLGTSVLAGSLLWGSRSVSAEPVKGRVVRLAELEIDSSQLERYKAALREEIETSIRVEPGVLNLYAVSVKGHPDQIRLFEMYASAAAYQAHLETTHFKKYKTETAGMVKSLTLLETEPILLGSKFK